MPRSRDEAGNVGEQVTTEERRGQTRGVGRTLYTDLVPATYLLRTWFLSAFAPLSWTPSLGNSAQCCCRVSWRARARS